MSLLSQTAAFDPIEPVRYTTNLHTTGNGRLNQYERTYDLFLTPQAHVAVYTDETNGKELVVKSVKRRNAARDKFQMLRRNNQGRKGALLSTEQSIHREIAILKTCRHANIVRLVEVVDDPRKDKVFMVMEYLRGGKVQWHNDDMEPILTVNQTRRIFRDVVCGLEYLHYLGIVARDLKPDNLIFSENRAYVKLIDFGISHFSPNRRKVPFATWRKSLNPLKDMSLFPPTDLLRLKGTEYFIAPEVVWVSSNPPSAASSNTVTLDSASPASSAHDMHEMNASQPAVPPAPSVSMPSSRPPITKAIDIWSLGVTLYCLLFGRLPFEVPRTANQHPNHARFVLYHEICSKDWTLHETIGADQIPVEAKHRNDPNSVISLLDAMLKKNPKERITLDAIKRHPWLLEDIANPDDWLVDTSPASYFMPAPFRWIRKVVNRLMSLTHPTKKKTDFGT